MFEEFKKSLKASLYERTASPIIGAFVSTWIIFNWKLCFIIAFADDSIYERLTYIEKSPYIDIWPNLYFPVIAAALFVGLYPLISLLPYMWWEWYAKKKAEIKNSMQRGVLLSLEKSIEIRNEIDNQEAKFEEMLKSKEQRNAELLVMHDNLQKMLTAKEQENMKLQQQLQDVAKKKPLKEKSTAISPADTWPFPSPIIENKSSGGFIQDAIKNAEKKRTTPLSERALMEAEWDAEFDNIVAKNPKFPALFNEAMTSVVDTNRHLNSDIKKVCLAHGVIQLADNNKIKITEKGQYMAKKVV